MSVTWRKAMGEVLNTQQYRDLCSFLSARSKEANIYPDKADIYRCLRETPLDSVKVVIVGQDPYHSPGAANGLAFAVNKGLPQPPSLRNIFKEVETDLNTRLDKRHTTLLGWARQGVLLLNTALTVEEVAPGSHAQYWGFMTDSIIRAASLRGNTVFMLWGNHAKSRTVLIDRTTNKILEAGHPSPFSVSKFYGCRHFSQANDFLKQIGKTPIDWTQIDEEQDV